MFSFSFCVLLRPVWMGNSSVFILFVDSDKEKDKIERTRERDNRQASFQPENVESSIRRETRNTSLTSTEMSYAWNVLCHTFDAEVKLRQTNS